MDALRRHDLEVARSLPAGAKLAEALQMMATGVRFKRAGLKARCPAATEAELDAWVKAWLEHRE